MESIVIIGYGGLAKEIAQYIADINEVKQKWEFIGYCGEISSIIGMRIGASSIVMEDNELLETGEHRAVVIGSGLSKVMAQIHEKFSTNCNLYYPNIIHPSTYIASDVPPDSGTIVCPGAVISVNTIVGKHNIFNWNSTIGHDAMIGDFNVFSPGCNVSGCTRIGSRVFVGTGAQVIQGLSICDDVVVGAGAVVTKSIFDAGVYVGVPAKPIGRGINLME